MKKILIISFCVLILAGITPVNAQNKWELPGYDGIYKNNKKLTLADVIVKTTVELGFMRNEIYARYGRKFKTAKYDEYFRKLSWYIVKDTYKDSMLTPVDLTNIELIQSIEQPKQTRKAYIDLILNNIDYSNEQAVLTFSDENHVIIDDMGFGNDDYMAYYNSQGRNWYIIGDWVVVSGMDSGNSELTAYYLNHKNRTIEQVVVLPYFYVYKNGRIIGSEK